MRRIIFTILFCCSFLLMGHHAVAQQSSTTYISRMQLPKSFIPLGEKPGGGGLSARERAEARMAKMDISEKKLMQAIGDIYELHVQSVRDQINDDPLAAETHIKQALGQIQQLLDENKSIENYSRFNELYRTVYTEYREFYGITRSENQEQGEVFAVRRELYEDDDWNTRGYALPSNITKPATEVPLLQNEYVNKHLMYYSMKRPEVMQRWINRSDKYFPMMKRIFRDEGVPEELVHLSMIESGLNPNARSWASAVGMWQFIRATGSMYGLDVNYWVDERKDPEKATRAAAQHLGDLYDIWGDWYLAIANYNISPRGLKRAINAGGGEKNYWSAYPYLPRETQGYIPGFVAATMINLNAEAFGFETPQYTGDYRYDVATVAPLMPLEDLAKAAGITTEELKDYNPELLRWATPPENEYQLKLPPGTKAQFMTAYNTIPKDQRSKRIAIHTVSSGETLGRIAQKYGTSVRAIFESNNDLSSTIYPGQKITVPVAPGGSSAIKESMSKSSASRTPSPPKRPAKTAKMSYTVKRGDTIGHVAEWYDQRASQIRRWNRTSNSITVGEKLTIFVPTEKKSYYAQVDGFSRSKKDRIEKEQRSGQDIISRYGSSSSTSANANGSASYTVQRNDTLIKIAQKFGVTVSSIKQANNMSSSRIYQGQTLRINR